MSRSTICQASAGRRYGPIPTFGMPNSHLEVSVDADIVSNLGICRCGTRNVDLLFVMNNVQARGPAQVNGLGVHLSGPLVLEQVISRVRCMLVG